MLDVVTGLRQIIQDLVAPELKSHSAKLDALQRQSELLQKTMDMQHNAVMKTLDAFHAEMRFEIAALKASN